MKNRTVKIYFKNLIRFLFVGTRKMKIASSIIIGIFLLYLGLLIYPKFLFPYSFSYENFNVYSMQPLDGIEKVLVQTVKNVSASEINNQTITHNIYLCNNYKVYTFFAPFTRKAFACNYPLFHSIFVANCNIAENEGYKNDVKDTRTRNLGEILAHEATHSLLENKFGFWKR